MIYPAYIDTIQSITLLDPLSEFLGVFEDGEVTFTYLDIVKNAGHSCPTVAGAYMMALYGLKRLYKESIPVRGEIVVSFSTELSEGVTGVVANVMTHITGATQNSGFKGIQGNFSRVGLMHFSEDFKADVKLTRVDTQESILVTYDATLVPPEKEQMMLMRKIIQKNATPDEKALFKEMWQRRVEKILSSGNLVISIQSVE